MALVKPHRSLRAGKRGRKTVIWGPLLDRNPYRWLRGIFPWTGTYKPQGTPASTNLYPEVKVIEHSGGETPPPPPRKIWTFNITMGPQLALQENQTKPTSTKALTRYEAVMLPLMEDIKASPHTWQKFKEAAELTKDAIMEELINIYEMPKHALEGVPVAYKAAKKHFKKLRSAWTDFKLAQAQELVGDVPPLHERRLYDEQTGESGKPVKRRMDNANSTNFGEIDGELGKMPLLDDRETTARMGYHFRPMVEKVKDCFTLFSKYEPPQVNPDLYYELALEALFLPRSHKLLIQLKQKARRWVQEYDMRKHTREQQYVMVAKAVTAAFFIHPQEELLVDLIKRNRAAMKQHEKFWKTQFAEVP